MTNQQRIDKARQLQRRALARVALVRATVESFYDGSRSGTAEQCLLALCESHERLRAELQGAEILLEENSQEATSILTLLDGLTNVWGDEGVFRRCRDRLRKLAGPPKEGDAVTSKTVCAICRHRETPPNRSVCLTCLPEEGEVDTAERACVPNGYGLCATHPVCDYMRATVGEYQGEVQNIKGQWVRETQVLHKLTETQSKRIENLERALRYAADCSTLEMVRDTMRGMALEFQPGLRQELRDFAEDTEQHDIHFNQWKTDRGHGVTLYCHGDFYAAYFDDASVLWEASADDLPMFHVMVQSDPPHRTVIHSTHLAAWTRHFAEICMPLQIMGWNP